MRSQPLIIRTCCHILPDGRHCGGSKTRLLSPSPQCAHSRLHNMARARRCFRLPRLLVAETPRDLAYNQAEVDRVLATERIDPDVATTMLWALSLTADVLRAEETLRRLGRNPNVFYHVGINPSTARLYTNNPIQVSENTMDGEGGGKPTLRPGNALRERVAFPQPRSVEHEKKPEPGGDAL